MTFVAIAFQVYCIPIKSLSVVKSAIQAIPYTEHKLEIINNKKGKANLHFKQDYPHKHAVQFPLKSYII